MAKTIKFNLICDEKPVRTIEDLQNNFSIEDVLAYYNNGLLQRWLRVRGYDKELEAVSAITSQKPMEVIKELIRIFDVVADEQKVEESIYMLGYLEERKELCALYGLEGYKIAHIIDDYVQGYHQLVLGILANPDDVAVVKANIAEIASNYEWILDLNHRTLFWALINKSPLAIMCLLMNSKSRRYYLPTEEVEVGTINLPYAQRDMDKDVMLRAICNLVDEPYFADKLGVNIHTFAGMTDGYWKDLEPKGKQYMIISMGEGDYVRAACHSGGDLACADVRYKFVIVDGIDYKSNSKYRKLLYMEV